MNNVNPKLKIIVNVKDSSELKELIFGNNELNHIQLPDIGCISLLSVSSGTGYMEDVSLVSIAVDLAVGTSASLIANWLYNKFKKISTIIEINGESISLDTDNINKIEQIINKRIIIKSK